MEDAKRKENQKKNLAWSEKDEKMIADAFIMLGWYKGNNWWAAQNIKI